MKLGEFELNQTYCGNNTELIKGLPDASIDLTVTSPPYGELRTYNGYKWDFETLAKELHRVTKAGGVVVWVVCDETIKGSETGSSFRQALYFKDVCGFNLHDTMIYQVPGTGAKGSTLAYWQAFEYMFIFSKDKPKSINLLKKKNIKAGHKASSGKKKEILGTRLHPNNGTVVQEYGTRDNVWRIHAGMNGDEITNHPAVFPEALARDHIISWSNPGDIILDPFHGSGTTGKMAIETGRQFIGFEISQEYVNLCNRRTRGAKVPLFDWTST